MQQRPYKAIAESNNIAPATPSAKSKVIKSSRIAFDTLSLIALITGLAYSFVPAAAVTLSLYMSLNTIIYTGSSSLLGAIIARIISLNLNKRKNLQTIIEIDPITFQYTERRINDTQGSNDASQQTDQIQMTNTGTEHELITEDTLTLPPNDNKEKRKGLVAQIEDDLDAMTELLTQ